MVSISSVLDFIFPPICPHCRQEGDWLCAEARQEITQLHPMVDPLHIAGVDRVLVCGSYDVPIIATIIHALKFSGWSALTPAISLMTKPMGPLLPRHGTLIPVPLHRKRQRERGFNQATCIAEQIRSQTGLPVRPLLRRIRATSQQAKLSEHERAKNITGAFQFDGSAANVPNSGIIVDDVITTGATIGECAKVLRAAGIEKIIAIGLAKG